MATQRYGRVSFTFDRVLSPSSYTSSQGVAVQITACTRYAICIGGGEFVAGLVRPEFRAYLALVTCASTGTWFSCRPAPSCTFFAMVDIPHYYWYDKGGSTKNPHSAALNLNLHSDINPSRLHTRYQVQEVPTRSQT